MIKAIVACDTEMGIGKNGTLPWPANKEDLKKFKEKTTGHVVVMGSKTWDDPFFPGPLKDRINVVISSNPDKYFEEGAQHALSSCDINYIKQIAKDKDIWIIGGASIYSQFSEHIEELHLTNIPGYFGCDTFLDIDIDDFTIVNSNITPENIYYTYRREN